ncbi:MAG: tetratricopeptide repeat protein [Deltaproteobacteria bacterium]|nr:tetratricopeptide repeat protein [Deltaproteobacteria bacterium]
MKLAYPAGRMACALALLAGVAVPGPARAASVRVVEPAAESATPGAKAALRRALAASRNHDYETALAHFERALSMSPSPKLHFNIGVCHHQLMVEHDPGSTQYQEHQEAAIASYNRYLDSKPDDAATVEGMIVALGGTPVTQDPEPWTIELVEPGEVPDPPGFDEMWMTGGEDPPPGDPQPDDPPPEDPTPSEPPPQTSGLPPPPAMLRGRFGGFVPLWVAHPGQLSGSSRARALPVLGLGLRGNAFMGPQRKIALGGEVAVAVQPMDTRTHHRLSIAHLGVVLEVRHPLGTAGRFEVGGGGMIGAGTEALVYSGTNRLRCAVNREASRRTGLLANARLYLAALLGKRRNHELSLRVGPGLGVFAQGSRAARDADGNSCADGPTPFAAIGLPDGAALAVTFDLGYAPRF